MTAEGALERLRGSPRPRVLFVAHAFGGGVARHVAELARAIAGEAEVLILQPHLDSFVALRWLRAGEELALWMHATDEWERLIALLESIGVDRVHFHHVHGLPRAILELPRRLASAHDVTLHDYFPACPAYHLMGGDARPCAGDASCRRCLEGGPAQWGLSIGAWRAAFGELLAHARHVIAPSADAARRIRGFFPDVCAVVWPHCEDEQPRATLPVRVLVPGAISSAKGLDVLEACVRDAASRRLPLHFRVLGYVAHPIPSWPAMPFSLTGEYRDGDLDSLIALERGDVFFFPAQCFETFSYTLSAALATPLPIVATDLGALPERLAQRANARIVAWDAPPAAMNEALIAMAAHAPASPPSEVQRMAPQAYKARYLEGLARSRNAPKAPVALEPRWLDAPPGSPALSSLAWLFDDAVRCGRGSSLEELRRRTEEADAQLAANATALAHAQTRIAQLSGELAQREAELEAAQLERERLASDARASRGRLDVIESSRSWRLTAPLRALARRLRGEA